MAQQPIDGAVAEFLLDTGWTDGNKVNAISILNRVSRWLDERGTSLLGASKPDVVA